MPRVYQTKLWQLQVPEAWSVEGDKEQRLVTFFRPDGVGLLRVLTDDGQPPEQEGQRDDFRGRLPGTTWSSAGGDRYMRYWSLRCRGCRLLISYTCAAKNADLERSEVDDILQSISETA